METKEEIDIDFESLERYFPKGDKRRGEALVVNAEAMLRGKSSERQKAERFYKALLKDYQKNGRLFGFDIIKLYEEIYEKN